MRMPEIVEGAFSTGGMIIKWKITKRKEEWILILIKAFDRINRIDRNFFDHFPEENGQNLIAFGEMAYITCLFLIGRTMSSKQGVVIEFSSAEGG